MTGCRDRRSRSPRGRSANRSLARWPLVAVCVGLGLSLSLGPEVLLVGAAGYACGIGYDVWLRTRQLAWLAFAAAFPLLLA